MSEYKTIVTKFAEHGAEIIRTDPSQHYDHIGRDAKRPMEPGFIPVEAQAKVVTVSYYPNETELRTPEYEASRASFEAWGKSGSLESYKRAYSDWVRMLPQIPFYRDFNRPIFDAVGVADDEYAWLPLVKCPLPARSKPPDDDVKRDRMLLWDQIMLLKPSVIIAQGMEAHDVVAGMCRDKFPHHMILQRIGRVGTNEYHQAEYDRVIRDVKRALSRQ